MSSLLVKVGINGAGFKTGLASLKASAMNFKAGLQECSAVLAEA